MAHKHIQANIMSVACGHLREAELSKAFQEHRVGTLVGLDADPFSRAAAATRLGERPDLTLLKANVRQILTSGYAGSKYHLIYSLGLYDYLEDQLAARLTAALFKLLAPGGTLLVAKFMPNLPDAGSSLQSADSALSFTTGSVSIGNRLSRFDESDLVDATCFFQNVKLLQAV